MDEPVTLEGKVGQLQAEVEELRAICAYLYLAIKETALLGPESSKLGLATIFKPNEAPDINAGIDEMAKRLDEALNVARAMIWKE